jgi:ribosomal protein S12 methylthiotransferase accessory factor
MSKLLVSNIQSVGDALTDPVTGIVRWFRANRRWLGDPNLHFVSAELVDTSNFGGTPYKKTVVVGGGGSTRTEAIDGCLGEAVERYSATMARDSSIVVATSNDLPRSRSVVTFSEPSSARAGDGTDAPRSWVSGETGWDAQPVWIPAALVFFPFRARAKGDHIVQQTTTGLAAGSSPSAAALSGLHEMIERDALALTWHLKVRVPEVDLSRAACPDVSDAVDRATASGATVRLFETTTDCEIPAYLALSVSDEAGPAVTAGAAANIHGCRAARKAIIEASFTRALAARQVRVWTGQGKALPTDSSIISDFGLRALWYSDPSHNSAFDFCSNRPKKPIFPSVSTCKIPPQNW